MSCGASVLWVKTITLSVFCPIPPSMRCIVNKQIICKFSSLLLISCKYESFVDVLVRSLRVKFARAWRCPQSYLSLLPLRFDILKWEREASCSYWIMSYWTLVSEDIDTCSDLMNWMQKIGTWVRNNQLKVCIGCLFWIGMFLPVRRWIPSPFKTSTRYYAHLQE